MTRSTEIGNRKSCVKRKPTGFKPVQKLRSIGSKFVSLINNTMQIVLGTFPSLSSQIFSYLFCFSFRYIEMPIYIQVRAPVVFLFYCLFKNSRKCNISALNNCFYQNLLMARSDIQNNLIQFLVVLTRILFLPIVV
jgi:hypothetical protein